MDAFTKAVHTTPIIDHHAHNLLLPSQEANHSFLSITSEATGTALEHATSTLAHTRAIKQLSEILGCESELETVQSLVQKKRKAPNYTWARKCFEGIECALIDDGLDGEEVYPYHWHDSLTKSKCKRIIRIETLAEDILRKHIAINRSPEKEPDISISEFQRLVEDEFSAAIQRGSEDPEVAGFKSVICYRTGLAIPHLNDINASEALQSLREAGLESFTRLKSESLNPYFVHLTAKSIERFASKSQYSKPLQFHTGLGDNDLSLKLASPSHLQIFAETYPTVPIVLLHAGYPFTKEAGYLANVYANVYLDVGEIFPAISHDGQDKVIREALELCPTTKLMWSSDGHRFPETFLLAVIQIREVMVKVLQDYVYSQKLETSQAITIVEDIFFNTANRLYRLDLAFTPVALGTGPRAKTLESTSERAGAENHAIFMSFLEKNQFTKYVRLQWLDYTASLRVRILPVRHAINMFRDHKSIGITKAVFGLLQNDAICRGFSPIGEYQLHPCFDSLRKGAYATMQCEFREDNGKEVAICPRTVLRKVVEKADAQGRTFLVGFELEVIFMKWTVIEGEFVYGHAPVDQGHAWSSARALQDQSILDTLEEVLEALEKSDIDVLQFHPESAPGQYEFVVGPLPPLQAVDTLLVARDIICTVAMKNSLKATFTPKPNPQHAGTGAHIHLSMSPAQKYESFYAGVLKHLEAITAFTYSNITSYERLGDSVWSGGTWIAWGTQNRETPLRKVEGSHWEVKCVDGLANNYLALAAIIGAGFQGILDEEDLPMQDCPTDPALLSSEERKALGIHRKFPTSIKEALKYLREDSQLREIIGDAAADTYLVVKEAENEMLEDMTPEKRKSWLIERY